MSLKQIKMPTRALANRLPRGQALTPALIATASIGDAVWPDRTSGVTLTPKKHRFTAATEAFDLVCYSDRPLGARMMVYLVVLAGFIPLSRHPGSAPRSPRPSGPKERR
jgi:hypothetical protein